MNNFCKLLLLFMYSKNVHPTAVGDDQIITTKIVHLPTNNEMSKHTLKSVLEIVRKRGKQEPGVDIGMFVSGISDAFNNVLKYNLTADNLIADTSKLIPEDTRGTLENVIDNIPEPINSILKGPLEQFNGFLQLGKTTTELSTSESRTVSPTISTVRTTRATTQSPPPMQPQSENSKPQTAQPADQVVSINSSEIISYPVDSNVQTEPVSNKVESPKDIMEPHIADSFQNVSSTLTGSKIIAVAITNTVSNWFQNISKDFHISKRPLIVNGQEDVVDDEDEKLPPAVYIPKSNTNIKPPQATVNIQPIPNKNALPIIPLSPPVVQNSVVQSPIKPYRNRRPPFSNNNAQNIPNEQVQQSQPAQQFQTGQQYAPAQQLQPSNQFQSQQQYQPPQQFQPNSNGQQIQSNQQSQQFLPGQQFQQGQGQQYQQGQGQQFQQGQGQRFQQGQGQQFQQGQGQQFQQGQGQQFQQNPGQQFQQGQGQQFQQNPGQQFQQNQQYQPNQQGQQNQQFQELQQSQQFQAVPQFQAVQSFPQVVVQGSGNNPSISSGEADILKQLGILSNPNVQVITIPNVALAAAQTAAPVAAEVPVTESPATPPTEVDEDDDDAETAAS